MGSAGESTMKERRTLIVRAVLKSQCFAFSDNPRECVKAVFPISGTFGRTALIMGIGDEVSISMKVSKISTNSP